MLKNTKDSRDKDLEKQQLSTIAPAYKENPKTAQKQGKIDTSELTTDLAEIVTVWSELPEHIKAAIKTLVQTHKAENK